MLSSSVGVTWFPNVYSWLVPKRLRLEEHLSSEELQYHYRKAKDSVKRATC